MGYTSTAVKRKYNEKTYSRFVADIHKDDFEKLESARGNLSRAQFLMMLFQFYQNNSKNSENLPD